MGLRRLGRSPLTAALRYPLALARWGPEKVSDTFFGPAIRAVLVLIAVRAAGIAAVSIVVAVRAKRPNASYLSEESPAWSPSDRARHRHTRPTSMIACKIQNDIASDSSPLDLTSRRDATLSILMSDSSFLSSAVTD